MMHRFWVFPLVLGFVGSLFPVICMAQGWLAATFGMGRSAPLRIWQGLIWTELCDVFAASAGAGVALGVGLGLVEALVEMKRFGRSDRSGIEASGRLLGNLTWLGTYALLVNGSLAFAVWAVVGIWQGNSGKWLTPISVFFYLPPLFHVGFGVVNLTALLWAATRTAGSDDVLSPRVLFERLGRSAEALR